MERLTNKTNVNLFNMEEKKEYFVDIEDKFCPWIVGVTKENNIVTIKYYDFVEKIEEKGENLELYSIIQHLKVQELANDWKKIVDIVDSNVWYDNIDISTIEKVNLYDFINVIIFGLECDCLLDIEEIKEF